jgi:phosphoribosylanthranilate isomerase
MIAAVKRVRIKICGLTNPHQAREAAKCGADAIGMVFAESPRRIDLAQAAAVARAVPPLVARVGVFVNAGADEINEAVRQASLDYVQLHGDERPELVDELAAPVIKAIRVRDEGWLAQTRQWLAGTGERVRAILLDAYKPGVPGGTGETFNWQWVADARALGAMDDLPPVILSGGLDEANVLTAISAIQPWAVDVSSGVERAPGDKDLRKVSSLIATVVDDVPRLDSEFWK